MWRVIEDYFHDIFEDKVLVVVPAGNYASLKERSDRIPAIWGLRDELPIIVAGADALRGQKSHFSQQVRKGGNDLTVWVPGKDVVCTGNDGIDQGESGIGFAAAMVLHIPFPQALR